MPAQLTTQTSELDESRVRVEVEVAPETLERELQSAARALGNDLKIPGFRKGKVPPQVVLQRIGREAVLDEAVRRALPGWYERAIGDARVAAVGDPSVDLESLPSKGEPLQFSIEVAVRPKAKLGDYRGVEVGRREPEVSDEAIDAELERLRESSASLETVEREARSGDFVVLDFQGSVGGEPFEGGEARGYPLELGSGRLVEGFEEQLTGATAGEERTVEVTFPEDYRAEELAGKDAVFEVSVKEVKEKRLPELDDDFAAEAGGFDTIDELREDLATRLREVQEREIEGEFREAAVDAVAEAAQIDLPQSIVHSKAHEMWGHTRRRLLQQGLDPAQYLQITGKTEHELIEEAEPDAERALRRESVLAALVEAEGIEVSEEELIESLRQAVAAGGRQPDEDTVRKTLDRLVEEGRDEALREDIAMRKAVDLVVEHAKPIPPEQAQAREKLWTPEKEQKEKPGQIWTPGA
ncbi:MAG TPA: trigger factor [Thermoleophilaceae bacterium]